MIENLEINICPSSNKITLKKSFYQDMQTVWNLYTNTNDLGKCTLYKKLNIYQIDYIEYGGKFDYYKFNPEYEQPYITMRIKSKPDNQSAMKFYNHHDKLDQLRNLEFICDSKFSFKDKVTTVSSEFLLDSIETFNYMSNLEFIQKQFKF